MSGCQVTTSPLVLPSTDKDKRHGATVPKRSMDQQSNAMSESKRTCITGYVRRAQRMSQPATTLKSYENTHMLEQQAAGCDPAAAPLHGHRITGVQA